MTLWMPLRSRWKVILRDKSIWKTFKTINLLLNGLKSSIFNIMAIIEEYSLKILMIKVFINLTLSKNIKTVCFLDT